MKNLRRIISLILIIGGLSFFAYKGYDKYTNYKKTQDISQRSNALLENLKDDTNINTVEAKKEDPKEAQREKYTKYIEELNKEFETTDIIARLLIPKIGLDYVVVRSVDNKDYLDKDIYGDYSQNGTIFMDKDNSEEFTDFNTLIYGHKMADGQMFGKLNNYYDENFIYNGESNDFTVINKNGEYKYELISSLVMPNSKNDIPIERMTEEFKNTILLNSVVDLNITDLKDSDQLVTLITCYPENGIINDDKRIVLVGRKIN